MSSLCRSTLHDPQENLEKKQKKRHNQRRLARTRAFSRERVCTGSTGVRTFSMCMCTCSVRMRMCSSAYARAACALKRMCSMCACTAHLSFTIQILDLFLKLQLDGRYSLHVHAHNGTQAHQHEHVHALGAFHTSQNTSYSEGGEGQSHRRIWHDAYTRPKERRGKGTNRWPVVSECGFQGQGRARCCDACLPVRPLRLGHLLWCPCVDPMVHGSKPLSRLPLRVARQVSNTEPQDCCTF